jgi:hypothetical protein
VDFGVEEINSITFKIACVLLELNPEASYSIEKSRAFTIDVDDAYTIPYPTFTQVPICNQPLLYEVLINSVLYDTGKTWVTFDDENA